MTLRYEPGGDIADLLDMDLAFMDEITPHNVHLHEDSYEKLKNIRENASNCGCMLNRGITAVGEAMFYVSSHDELTSQGARKILRDMGEFIEGTSQMVYALHMIETTADRCLWKICEAKVKKLEGGAQ